MESASTTRLAILVKVLCGVLLSLGPRPLFGQELRIGGLRTVDQATAKDWIENQWQVIQERGLSPPRASDASFLLELAFRQRGYPDAEVDWEILGNQVLRLEVTEGRRLLLGVVTIRGAESAEHLDPERMRAAMMGDLRSRQSLLRAATDDEVPYVPASLDRGVATIEGHAAHRGYLKAEAILEDVAINEAARRVDVTVRVDPGPYYEIREVQLRGVSDVHLKHIQPELAAFAGEPLNVENTRKAQGIVLTHYQDRGFFDATVEIVEGAPIPPPEETRALVVLEVREGERYRVTDIAVSGNVNLDESFVRKRFDQFLQDSYDPVAVNKAYRELIQTGLFTNLQVVPEPVGPGRMRLAVEVEEAKTQELGIYGGYGSFDGYILGLTYANQSLFGTGRSFRARAEYNARGISGDSTYLDRWFLDSKFRFSLQAFAGTKTLDGYDKWELGLRATLTRPISDYTSFSLFGEIRHTSITRNAFVNADIGPEDYQMELFGLSYNWDHSEDLETTGHGYSLSMSVDYANSLLLGDVDFLRGNIRYTHYFKLFADTELRLGARVGVMVPLSGSDIIPIDDRFFNGGSRSVRSFPERELGPQDARHHPLGGEFMTVFNAEYLVPIADSFRLAVFTDAGNLLSKVEDAGFDDMSYAAGLGLRYDLPIGPLRVDYGWNLNQRDGEPSGTFHLAFGFAF